METNLYLIRHAHSIYTPDEQNRPLSDKGFIDAARVAHIMNEQKMDLIYASPYRRAIQTVEGIAVHQQKRIHIIEDFKERKLAGKPVADFECAMDKVWEDPQFSWEGGESNDIAQKRGGKAVLKLLACHEGQKIVIGTHGNIMVLIMNFFDERYGYDFWKRLAMPDIYRLVFQGKTLMDVHRCWK